jgi:hypothetical protein
VIALAGALGLLLAAPAAVSSATPAAEETPEEPIWLVPVGHGAGLLAGMRLSLSVIWPGPYHPLPLSRSGRQFGRAYTAPPELRPDRHLLESDGDPWTINLVGHGLFGSEVHGRVRQCGGAFWQALLFTAATSVVWEYGIESFNKRPSAVDLVVTPLLGAALGEARHHALRWLRARPPGFWRTFGAILVDPLGSAERAWLGTRC